MEPPPFLPEELRLEILSWLPVKSLVRFRCVSHSWKSTISDSQFIKLHLHRSSSTRKADFAHLRSLINSPWESRSATTVAVPDEYDFGGTCNGLICLFTLLKYDIENHEFSYLFRLWNPATRSMSQYSPPLRFTRPCYFGFGYDSSTDTYKVVVVTLQRNGVRTVNVYNKGDTCWRTIQVSHLPFMYPQGRVVYVSNTLNWLAIRPDVDENDRAQLINSYTILTFDLGKENCAQLSLPYFTRLSVRFIPILGVLRGCLCISLMDTKMSFMIWQMKEFGVCDSWTMLLNITLSESIFQNINLWPDFAMYMSNNGDALLISKSCQTAPYALLYTQKENKLEVTGIANDIVDCYAHNYIESLVPPC
ncbi:F-box/kelch-repeat protein At3g23880-like [Lotus japonicus]|uniref:F-box/kelch-repeat protein At3g23880-like n=1 Tax=Lotus japonicus TaxID=34305 RepID=UPI00258CC2C7|nr:F-box/kelch-repeat protein At3g23880-like [Lotus japonicus]